jgi:hypothetical protein
MPRRTSKRVAESLACEPLREMYENAVQASPASWDQVEDGFLRAMERFDANVASGLADQGDRQNGKGDFFNDLLALLLENCAEVVLDSRGGVPGFIFPKHNLDITYPSVGTVEFLLEAKAVGLPKHPRNEKQKNPLGRPGSADVPKRLKEAAFKTIDLKAEYGRIQAMRGKPSAGGPGGNLTSWSRENKPKSYLFMSARVVDDRDLRALQALARAGGQVLDGVGIYAFRPVASDRPTTYKSVPVDRDVDLAAVLYRACQDLVKLKNTPPEPTGPPGPAQEAAELIDPDEADDEL